MPLYFFDIHNGQGLVPDEEGTILSDLEDAQREAVMSIADIARTHRAINAPHEIAVEVKDESKRTVLVATLTVKVPPN